MDADQLGGNAWLEGIPSLGHAPAEALPAMRDRVHPAAVAAGRVPEDITCALNVEVHVGYHADVYPGVITGSAERVATSLGGFASAGFSAFNFMPRGHPAGCGTRSTPMTPNVLSPTAAGDR
ncbi:MAG: hypothetical protein ACYDH5_18410 [Acidimicrobiales bacterium]